MINRKSIIEIKNLKTELAGTLIHDGINLTIYEGEIFGIVGGSGSGKTTLMREMLGLQQPKSGEVRVFDQDILHSSPQKLLEIQRRWGVLFQENALFGSLTVLENIAFPLYEYSFFDEKMVNELALLKILLAGLPIEVSNKYPAELSGGMQKRAAMARAIILDPELVFLDEPTAALDPESAAGIDDLISTLQKTLGLTVVIITHDLDTLWRVTDRVAFLGEGKVLCIDAMEALSKNPNEMIQGFFNGPRGRAAEKTYSRKDDDGRKR